MENFNVLYTAVYISENAIDLFIFKMIEIKKTKCMRIVSLLLKTNSFTDVYYKYTTILISIKMCNMWKTDIPTCNIMFFVFYTHGKIFKRLFDMHIMSLYYEWL